jgi:hypothetical protein
MAPRNYRIHAPGYVVRPEIYGPDAFENFPGRAWTDQRGLTRGWGTTFRGRANTGNWFHSPIAVPLGWGDADLPERCNEVIVYLDLPAHTSMQAIHVWSRVPLFFRRDGLNVTGNYTNRVVLNENQFQFPKRQATAIGISVFVRFNAVADVTFSGVEVAFEDQP